jgi:hypothetical protein
MVNNQITLLKKTPKIFKKISPYHHASNKLFLIYAPFYTNKQYEKMVNICNKQGRYKKTGKHIYLSRHVLIRHLRGGAGINPTNMIRQKHW